MHAYTWRVKPLLNREQVRAVDARAIEAGVSGLILMENAGRGATDAIVERFGAQLARPVIVGGAGNNGGDGWVVARHLAVRGHRPLAVLCVRPDTLSGDAAHNYAALSTAGVETQVIDPTDQGAVAACLRDATLIIDALFGTGLTRPIEGAWASLIAAINAASAPKVALDLPSGIDADTGAVLGTAVKAQLTVTFAAHKRGLHQFPGVEHAGQVVLADIGVPEPQDVEAWLLSRTDLPALIAARAADAHKGTAGHVLVVGGSPGKTGAALLAGRAAFRAGAGLVTIAGDPDTRQALDQKVVEIMTTEIDADDPASLARACEGKRSVILGPGLGLDDASRRLVDWVAQSCPLPTVIDADALTLVAQDGLRQLADAKAPRVLTPHPGEAARLLGVSTAQVQADRFAAAATLAERSGQTVVLKGARTIVAGQSGVFVNTEGTSALGVAGTGDVLSGILGALVALDADPKTVAAGVLLHALAGARAASADRGLLASEVADAVPEVLGARR